ncbi:MAG: hypothetical protein B7Y26_01545 [Hydrogenophilales bacterium 16-64-46]|nr:MAG: hypothetical protein B7Z32_01245 [Hydrogenophilales bacterium 12-64-13]OYZ06517.1 MAG: hypothetical protein B7Y26_01545 [Hydrogenophilales bacterium 16-64-46]OZA39225.1 MAG: hypothetical protein B7X87_02650 [Hydrogenophilales bacterium 17-64-34]
MADMPVRAGMAQDPGQYRRNSYPHKGLGLVDTGITPHPFYFAIQIRKRVLDFEQAKERSVRVRKNNAKLPLRFGNGWLYGTGGHDTLEGGKGTTASTTATRVTKTLLSYADVTAYRMAGVRTSPDAQKNTSINHELMST